MRIGRRKYADIAAGSEVTDTYTVPTGKEVELERFGGNAGSSPDTIVSIKVNGTIEFSTHGDADHILLRDQIIANAGETIVIALTNDQTTADNLGAYWVGFERKA